MTEKLYDNDAYIKEFEALVTSCTKEKGEYRITLDKTAFFPEEGGQCCDKGTLNGIEVLRVEISQGEIFHYTKQPINCSSPVIGKIDFSVRYRNMQNHTGEHILCGILNKLYGCENTGFHLGKDNVTMDIDTPLTREQIEKAEYEANRIVFQNKKVLCYYPENPETLSYRSKLDLKNNVRIVEIEDTDMCACCAPHVKRTSEVGIIKIYDFMHFRGGTRIILKCGFDVYGDFKNLMDSTKEISELLSVKQQEISKGVIKLKDKYEKSKSELLSLEIKLGEELVHRTADCVAVFDIKETEALRNAVNKATEKFPVFAGLIPCGDGFRYIIGSKSVNLKDKAKEINNVLNGKGGGSENMIQGTFGKSFEEIKEYFKKYQ